MKVFVAQNAPLLPAAFARYVYVIGLVVVLLLNVYPEAEGKNAETFPLFGCSCCCCLVSLCLEKLLYIV